MRTPYDPAQHRRDGGGNAPAKTPKSPKSSRNRRTRRRGIHAGTAAGPDGRKTNGNGHSSELPETQRLAREPEGLGRAIPRGDRVERVNPGDEEARTPQWLRTPIQIRGHQATSMLYLWRRASSRGQLPHQAAEKMRFRRPWEGAGERERRPPSSWGATAGSFPGTVNEREEQGEGRAAAGYATATQELRLQEDRLPKLCVDWEVTQPPPFNRLQDKVRLAGEANAVTTVARHPGSHQQRVLKARSDRQGNRRRSKDGSNSKCVREWPTGAGASQDLKTQGSPNKARWTKSTSPNGRARRKITKGIIVPLQTSSTEPAPFNPPCKRREGSWAGARARRRSRGTRY